MIFVFIDSSIPQSTVKKLKKKQYSINTITILFIEKTQSHVKMNKNDNMLKLYNCYEKYLQNKIKEKKDKIEDRVMVYSRIKTIVFDPNIKPILVGNKIPPPPYPYFVEHDVYPLKGKPENVRKYYNQITVNLKSTNSTYYKPFNNGSLVIKETI